MRYITGLRIYQYTSLKTLMIAGCVGRGRLGLVVICGRSNSPVHCVLCDAAARVCLQRPDRIRVQQGEL